MYFSIQGLDLYLYFHFSPSSNDCKPLEASEMEILFQNAESGHAKQKVTCNSIRVCKQNLPGFPQSEESFLVDQSQSFPLIFLTGGA